MTICLPVKNRKIKSFFHFQIELYALVYSKIASDSFETVRKIDQTDFQFNIKGNLMPERSKNENSNANYLNA